MTSKLSQISGWAAIVALFAAGAVTTFMFGKEAPLPPAKVVPAVVVITTAPAASWLPEVKLPDVTQLLAKLVPGTPASLLPIAAAVGVLVAVVAVGGGLAMLFVVLDRQIKT